MRTVRGRWAALALALTAFVAMLGLTPGAAMAAEGNVARVGGTDYTTVEEALEHADEGTIYLLADVSDVVVPEETTATIDLGDHTVSAVNRHAITNNGTLTVIGGTVDGSDVGGKGAFYNADGATAYLNGGTYKGSKWYVIQNQGVMTLSGIALVQNDAGSSAIDNGYPSGAPADDPGIMLTIEGGTYSGGMNIVKNDDWGNLVINSGSFSNTDGPTVLNWHKATINGCTFEGKRADSNVISNGYIAGGQDEGLLVINGGIFIAHSENAPIFGYGVGGSNGGSVEVKGGDFTGIVDTTDYPYAPVITGGTFTDDVSEYVPEDYELNDDGTVTELPDVAVIGTVGYKSLNAAAAAAKDGDTIKLAADVALSEQLVIATDNVTLDLNGHTISCADDFAPASGQNDAKNLVSVNSCTGVTVKNGTIVAGLANRNTLNLWNAKDVTIEDMTLDNTKSSAGAPLIVGASEATVAGKLSVVSGGNSWYGINVDARMVGATATPASLTFAEGAVVDFSGIQKTGVYVENTAKVAKNDVSVSFEPSVTFSSNIDGFVPVVIAKSVEATVSNPENAGFVMNADGTSHFHTYVLDATTVKEPTCTAEGYTGNRVCSVCGDTIKGEAVPMVAHQLEVRGYVEPTTTTVGYTGDTVCKVCGTVVAKGETIPTVAPGEVVMFRLYNQWTGEHFYTSSELERDTIVKVGWSYEGVGWIAPDEGTPVYRLYNPYVEGGDHHYTMSEVERDACVEAGWSYEGVAWYSADEETGVPVLREYNPYATTGTHNYTISENEHDTLVELGWKDEGVAWYAVK